MWPEPVQRVSSFLSRAAVEATIQEFSDGTPTAEAAARAAGCRLEQIVKTLVFVCDGEYVLALVPGDRRADKAKVAAACDASSVRVATAEEVVAATGFEPGGVAPFPVDVTMVLIDQALLSHTEVWVGAGSSAHMAVLTPADLQRLTRARAVDLADRR